MTTTLPDAQQRVAATYNAASDFYDHPANSWSRFGEREANVIYTVATKSPSVARELALS